MDPLACVGHHLRGGEAIGVRVDLDGQVGHGDRLRAVVHERNRDRPRTPAQDRPPTWHEHRMGRCHGGSLDGGADERTGRERRCAVGHGRARRSRVVRDCQQRHHTHRHEDDEGDHEQHDHGQGARPPNPVRATARNEAALARPGRREGAGVGRAAPEHLLHGGTVGFGLLQIRAEIVGHLVGDRPRHPQPLPFAAALLDELAHGYTSASTEAKHRIDGVPGRPPFGDAPGEGAPASRRGPVVLARRPTVALRSVGVHEPGALEPAEQWIDRALAHDGQAAGAQSLRHLVAVRRPLVHRRRGDRGRARPAEADCADAPRLPCGASYCAVPCFASQSDRGRHVLRHATSLGTAQPGNHAVGAERLCSARALDAHEPLGEEGA